jgi:uncharacterized membrane protein
MKKILSFGQPDPVVKTSDAFGSYEKIWETIASEQKQTSKKIKTPMTQKSSMINL